MLVTEVRKAVIPAAGLGTRFLPATKAMPKEMLPLIDRPVIQYVVEEAVASGIDDLIIITGRGKRALEDYFDDSPELEMHLKKHRKHDMLKVIQDISSLVDIHYIRQKEPRGLGDAVLRAEKHIGEEPFAVLLGDDIIVNSIPCIKQLIDTFNHNRGSVIAVSNVLPEKVSSYGIISGRALSPSLYHVEDIIEKPSLQEAPSRIGAIGRYVFTPEIFSCLHEIQPGVGGEIQLTDAIRCLSQQQAVYAFEFSGRRYDTGDRLGYVQAIIDFALAHEEIGEQVMGYLQGINDSGAYHLSSTVNTHAKSVMRSNI
jgi:UTP--glucose-1-phosphate uridylyltransferase